MDSDQRPVASNTELTAYSLTSICCPDNSRYHYKVKTGNSLPFPVKLHLYPCRTLLLRQRLIVQFHAIADVDIFHSKHNHSRGRGRRSSDDHNFCHRAPRQIPHVNHWAVALLEDSRIEGRLLHLRVFAECSPERKRIHRIFQIPFILPDSTEIVPHLYPLVLSHVKVNLATSSQVGVEIFAHYDPP